jgi:uncharacterized protein (TIGR02452 family)
MAERRAQVVFVNRDVQRLLPPPRPPKLVVHTERISIRRTLHSAKTLQVVVVQLDTLDAARAFRCSTVLNFANSRQLGGGYLHGAGAQEEQICYRSNLPLSLSAIRYPWADERDMVYSPGITVFRENESKGYDICRMFKVNVVTAAASYMPQVRTLDNGHAAYAAKEDALDMKERMRRVLQLAIKERPDDIQRRIVLGAWGCGAFGGPTYHVALLWREVLFEYRNFFSVVVMAVLGDNFRIFEDVFSH